MIELLQELAKIAPLATPVVAICALIFAWYQVSENRRIAQRKAALDFFLKTEMDEKMLEMWRKHVAGVQVLQANGLAGITPDQRSEIRAYLNIHELMAEGILNGSIDDKTCSEFWSDEFARAARGAAALINDIRQQPGGQHTYDGIMALRIRWRI